MKNRTQVRFCGKNASDFYHVWGEQPAIPVPMVLLRQAGLSKSISTAPPKWCIALRSGFCFDFSLSRLGNLGYLGNGSLRRHSLIGLGYSFGLSRFGRVL